MKLESDSRKSCGQRLFNAKLGAPGSDFNVVVQTAQCLGHESKLSDLVLGTVAVLEKDYHLSHSEYGAYSIKGLDFWVMRSKAAKIDHPHEVIIIEKVITVMPKGVVYWSAFCKDETAQKAFEHTRLHLANGGDSELIPDSAFVDVATSGADSKENK
jgi:hypothetical protein